MGFYYGDHVRVTQNITRRAGFFGSREVVVPAGAVGRVIGVPIFATSSSLIKVTFAAGVGVFHDEEIPGTDLEKVAVGFLAGAS